MATATATKVTDAINVTNNPEVLAAIREAAECKEIEKAGADAKKRREELEASIIRPALGGKHAAILRGVKVIQESSQRSHTSINQKLLREAFPEAYAATEVKTPYTFFTYSL